VFKQDVHILKKDIDIKERVQRIAIKLIEGYRHIVNFDRLTQAGLISKDIRKVSDDFISKLFQLEIML